MDGNNSLTTPARDPCVETCSEPGTRGSVCTPMSRQTIYGFPFTRVPRAPRLSRVPRTLPKVPRTFRSFEVDPLPEKLVSPETGRLRSGYPWGRSGPLHT